MEGYILEGRMPRTLLTLEEELLAFTLHS